MTSPMKRCRCGSTRVVTRLSNGAQVCAGCEAGLGRVLRALRSAGGDAAAIAGAATPILTVIGVLSAVQR